MDLGLSGVAGSMGGSKKYTYKDLHSKYDGFRHPALVLKVNDVDINKKFKFPIFDVVCDLTSGYEASTLEFSIGDVYDKVTASFLFDEVKKMILLGSKVELFTGYAKSVKRVFIGVITCVNFLFEEGDLPCIKVTAMDAKGVMMSSSFSRQIKANSYLDAVDKLLKSIKDKKCNKTELIKDINVKPASAEPAGAESNDNLDKTVEMVAESDYEFIVRAAKRLNYDFYVDNGKIQFRPAKNDKTVRMNITPNWGMHSFDIRYDITGMVESVEARGMDVSKGEVISKSVKYSTSNLSQGSYAASVLKGASRIYIDPSISSKEDAEDRAKSIYEMMSYRYGGIEIKLMGLPEFRPGFFYEITGLGTGADNLWYVDRVIHCFDRDGRYDARLFGKANGKK